MNDRLGPGDSPLLALLGERVVVADGAMGTELQRCGLTAADFGGFDGLNEILSLTRPDVVRRVHESYLEAGADIVETNTFGATAIVLSEYGQQDRVAEINRAAAVLAREAADAAARPGAPRFVSGSMGPTTKLPSLSHIRFDEMREAYEAQVAGLLAGGVDLLQIETCQDPLQIKAAVLGAQAAFATSGRRVPIFVQITIEAIGTMLVGTDIAAALTVLESLPIEGVGLNCATGPDLMTNSVRHFCQHSTRFVSVLPNAGLPRNVSGRAVYDLTPEQFAQSMRHFAADFGVNIVGGCCGTRPDHIKALREAVRGIRPKPRPETYPAQVASLYQAVALDQEGASPLYIGERTNANGSKRFRNLLLAEDWSGIVDLAKEQEGEGSHVLDVCVAYVGRNEVRDMEEVVRRLATQVTLPMMIDSTQVEVLEAALKLLGGRAIINSINLEDGEERFARIAGLAKRYGAALVALTIDEQGMAKTAESKLKIARRIYDLAVHRHGLSPESLLFDPLTFTIASGDEDSRDAGIQTLTGVQLIKQQLKGARTLLGLSNISFGLKPYARQVLNSVFLDEAVMRGLDAAILSVAKIIPIHQLDPQEVELARDLIYNRRREGYDPLFAFVDRFSGQVREASGAESAEDALPIEEALKRRIIEGKKSGIEVLLGRALEMHEPLQIINQILLEGMKVVGELFGSGRLQLPFVLQSAETMKTAVRYLQQFMQRSEGAEKGTMVLATVRGDVHDIGKNLVDIILSNNGYRVFNLGIKQPVESILQAIEKYRPNAVGLSGLLVKSTVVMKENLEEFARRGISVPVICGGAALNRGYVEDDLRRAYPTGPVFYGQDAFRGLRIMDELTGHAEPTELTLEPGKVRLRHGVTRAEREDRAAEAGGEYVPPDLPPAVNIPEPPFWGVRVLGKEDFDLREIFRYINKRALFMLQWQYRRTKEMSSREFDQFLHTHVEERFRSWQEHVIELGWLEPKAVYGYFPCNSERNDLVVFEPNSDRELARFHFPRQPRDKRRCISDFFLPRESGRHDMLAVHLVTMGDVASQVSKQLFDYNLYEDYLHFHGLSVESAEALAELVHRRIRLEAGFAQDDAETPEGLFRQGYRGSRYSFGYPACPRLEDQEILFRLIDPACIGVVLSEEYQLHPEQSTSAMIVHHQEAKYFSV